MHGLAGAIDGFEPLNKVEHRRIRQRDYGEIAIRQGCLPSPLFPTEGSQGPVPQLLRIELARFGRLNDPRRHDLIDDARLSGVVKVFAGRIECLTHDLGCMVVKDPGEACLFDKLQDRGDAATK